MDWRDWRLGARLRGNASGAWSQRATTLASTPPVVRKAAVREVMKVLRARGQVGSRPSVATDAQLRFSVMAYQSASMLFVSRDGDFAILVRFEGTCASAHSWGRAELAQRAKTRYSL